MESMTSMGAGARHLSCQGIPRQLVARGTGRRGRVPEPERRIAFVLVLAAVAVLSACGDTHRGVGARSGGAAGAHNEGVSAGSGGGSGSASTGLAGAVTVAGGRPGAAEPVGGGGASLDPGEGGAGSAENVAGMGWDPDAPVALVACPASMPEGACSIERLSCTYPTGSCWCDQGNWNCVACPGAQPGSGGIPCDINVSMACRYDAVTCSCQGTSGGGRGCGICPATRPTAGDMCGNSAFECKYEADTCACTDGRWECATAVCPVPPGPFSSINCVTPGRFTCRYPKEQQYCSCDPFNATSPVCSCPAALPAEGSACVVPGRWFDLGSPSCTYGASTCSCTDGAWHCTESCPLAAPTTGDACGAQLSCSYPERICGCDGTKWTCQ